eukprot:6203489-Pleurochrysis_carterae.AAC.1
MPSELHLDKYVGTSRLKCACTLLAPPARTSALTLVTAFACVRVFMRLPLEREDPPQTASSP